MTILVWVLILATRYPGYLHISDYGAFQWAGEHRDYDFTSGIELTTWTADIVVHAIFYGTEWRFRRTFLPLSGREHINQSFWYNIYIYEHL